MRRYLPLLLSIMLLFSACGKQADTVSAIDEANDNCDTPLHFTVPKTDAEEQTGYEQSYIWGGWVLKNEDVCYTFSGYPDALDAYHLTKIELLSEKYHFYGITLNDDFKAALKTLKSFGYKMDKKQSADYAGTVLIKDNVRFIIGSYDNSITDIRLGIITTNVNNVVF